MLHAAILARISCPFTDRIYDEPRRARIARFAELNPVVITPENFDTQREAAAQTEVLFTSWGFPHELVTAENFPALRLLLFSGGSVKYFARPLLERGIQVVGARAANAIAVAHFCLGQIILSAKGYFRNTRMCRNIETRRAGGCFTGPGLYGETVALLGLGAVARELASLLRGFDLKVVVVDPYLSDVDASTLGVRAVTMQEAFTTALIVSNHLPNLPELAGVLHGALFAAMRPDATFINTGRGAQVDEAGLIAVAQRRFDLMFLLDVTDPEPPTTDSPLYTLPNVQLSSHLAGALNDEVRRQGDFVIGEFERYAQGLPLRHADTLEMLERLG